MDRVELDAQRPARIVVDHDAQAIVVHRQDFDQLAAALARRAVAATNAAEEEQRGVAAAHLGGHGLAGEAGGDGPVQDGLDPGVSLNPMNTPPFPIPDHTSPLLFSSATGGHTVRASSAVRRP